MRRLAARCSLAAARRRPAGLGPGHAAGRAVRPADQGRRLRSLGRWCKVTGVFRTATQIVLGRRRDHPARGARRHHRLGGGGREEHPLRQAQGATRPDQPDRHHRAAAARPAPTPSSSPRARRRGRQTADTVFVLRFRYPADEKAQAGRCRRPPRRPRWSSGSLDLKLERAVRRGAAQPGLRRPGRRPPAALGGLRQRPLHGAALPRPTSRCPRSTRSTPDGAESLVALRRPRRVRGGPRRRPRAAPAPGPRGALHLQQRLRPLRPQPRHRHGRRRRRAHRQGSAHP